MTSLAPVVRWFVCLLVVCVAASAGVLLADDEAKQAAQKPQRYQVPETQNVDVLLKFIADVREFQPTSLANYLEHKVEAPVAIRGAAEKVFALEKDKDSKASKQAAAYLLEVRAQSIGEANPKERREVLAELKKQLAEKKPSLTEIKLAMKVAGTLEAQEDHSLAADAYTSFGAIFEKSDNPDIVKLGESMQAAAHRLTLVGKPMTLKGTTLDGQPFDLAQLKGKVVLIDFWATWCGPCIAEMPKIKKSYQQYHDRGFEVVGISLDVDRDAVARLLDAKQIPWIILHDQEAGDQHPAAKEYGVVSLPTTLLVGKDGNVVALGVRGDELGDHLEKLLGKVEK